MCETEVVLSCWMDNKNAFVQVYKEAIHISWITQDGKVIAFEDIPDNYPRSHIFIWNNIEEYIKDIKQCNWIWEEAEPYLADFTS